jgi:hypothetical protein
LLVNFFKAVTLPYLLLIRIRYLNIILLRIFNTTQFFSVDVRKSTNLFTSVLIRTYNLMVQFIVHLIFVF